MITGDQLFAHAVGDYVLQSDWMATEKTKRTAAAVAHACAYSVVFVALTRSPAALSVICGTHFMIDRWRLARYVVWVKNWIAPPGIRPPSFSECAATGYPPDRPAWLTVWLLIIADNLMHVGINALALRYL